MQIGRQLALNRRHPDFRGLVVCLPLNSRDINRNVDLVKRDVYTIGAGSPTKAVMPQGIGFSSTDASAYLVGTSAVSPWTTEFSVSCQIMMNGLAGSPGIWSFGGLGLAIETSGDIGIWNAGGGGASIQAGVAGIVATNTPYTVGVSYRVGSTTAVFYVNGRKIVGSGVAQIKTDQASNIGRSSQVSRETCDGKIRDVRVWNRVMPDATFERAHFAPNDFYTTARSAGTRVAGLNFGRLFFPFLHPSLSS